MANQNPYSIKTITEFHRLRNLPGPVHPLISVVRFEHMRELSNEHPSSWVLDFYAIALKKNFNAKLKYGQLLYDFDEGVMTFMEPGQKIGIEVTPGERIAHEGWLLIFHPDFLWNTPLAASIRQYEFFNYTVHEALFLSEQEEAMVTNIIEQIAQEYHNGVDSHSQNIMVKQLEVLLSYAQRFYGRQFITRQINTHYLLDRLEEVLASYFEQEQTTLKGLPAVTDIALALNVSPNYLSSALKSLTGKSTQEHIHNKLIEKAKKKLSGTTLTVSEIAYALGFEYPQSFSKLFKSKTSLSPLQFREAYN
jgi:AraC family transcriptional activator of pobA